MPDRLTDLQRQRTLIADHLAWLDRQIATESVHKTSPTPSAPAAQVAGPVLAPTPISAPLPSPSDAEAILAQYQTHPASLREDVRKGCLLYLMLAFALVAAGVAMLYVFRSGS